MSTFNRHTGIVLSLVEAAAPVLGHGWHLGGLFAVFQVLRLMYFSNWARWDSRAVTSSYRCVALSANSVPSARFAIRREKPPMTTMWFRKLWAVSIKIASCLRQDVTSCS